MLLRIFVLFSVFIIWRADLWAQPCDITTIASQETITCGNCTTLSAFGYGAGNIAFQEDFNSGSPVGWQFTQAVTIANNTCGVPSPDGSPFMWMGDASVNPRSMETVPFDLSQGGVICFEMRYSIQAGASPCEGPDLSNEGVYVQYSTDNGATWNTIQYWDPNGGNDPQLTNWNEYCVTIPAAAQTANTMIRWYQDDVSGAEYDHWGIDNVLITLNDPNFEISWVHDGYSYGLGQSGGENPNQVCPTTTTSYEAIITDGVETCNSTITIVVEDPVLIVDAGEDTTFCPGECIDLDAEAKVIVSPAGIKEFCDATIQEITGAFGMVSNSIEINVTGLNLATVTSDYITSVCITGLQFFGQNIFPPSTVDLSSFDISLSCPSGQSVQLVTSGDLSGQNLSSLGQETCFTLLATQPISNGTNPYDGDFLPTNGNSLNDLVGCSTEGNWTLTVNTDANIGFGFFNGWCITFDDPEISYEADFAWTPVTDMTNETTLTPTVCPTTTITYTLEASDANGCISTSDQITISPSSDCCDLVIDDIQITPASCGANDGEITIQTSGATTGLIFSIDGGTTFQPSNVFSNLPAGNYAIVVTDDNNCDVSDNVTISNNGAPVIDDIQITGSNSCTASNGSISVTVSGGTPPYQYSLDGGTTTQPGANFTGLSSGNYTVTVIDDSGCEVSSSVITIPGSGGAITADTDTQPNSACLSCNYDGPSIMINELMISPSSGDGSISGEGGSGNGRGEWIELYNPNWCDSVDISCYYLGNSAPGSIGGTNSGGYVIPQGTIVPPLGFALIRGANASPVPSQLLVENGGNVVELIVPYNITDPGVCVGTGTQRLWFPNAGGWFAFYDAQGVPQDAVRWGMGNTTDLDGTPCVPQSNCSFSGTLDSYNTIPDANKNHVSTLDAGSHIGQSIRRIPDGGTWDGAGTPSLATCNDPSNCLAETGISFCNGTATVTPQTGTAPFSYQWDDPASQTSQTALNLCAGNYTVVVTDANGCTATFSVTVDEDVFTIEATSIDPICYGTDGSISVITSPVTGNYQFDWSANTGITDNQTTTADNLGVDTYSVSVTRGGCTRDTSITLTSNGIESIVITTESTECGFDNGALSVTEVTGGTQPYSYQINSGSFGSSNQFTDLAAGNYTVTVEDAEGCEYTETDILVDPSNGIESITAFSTEATCGFDDGQIIVEQVFGGEAPYSFLLNNTLTSEEGVFTDLSEGEYTLTVEDNNGCILENLFTVHTAASIEEVIVPNVLTPNNDDVNDYWFVTADCVEEFECSILNRWGNLVYQYNDISGFWNGKDLGGNDSSEGVYFYKITLKYYSGNSEDLHGFITLVRK